MSVKEITTFDCGRYKVTVSGSELHIHRHAAMVPDSLTRQEARDLSKALLSASEIVRAQRKPRSKPA